MVSIDKSVKLVSNEFTKSIAEVPLEVYYQVINADQYTANGFQFNLKSPGQLALLDTDVWIKYEIQIRETAANAINNFYENLTNNTANTVGSLGAQYPNTTHKMAFRGGNVMQRGIQNLSVMINNRTITVQPYRWIDVMNRLYISNDASEHEFCGSGGRFDEGNHGVRNGDMMYRDHNAVYAGPTNNGVNNALAETILFVTPAIPNSWNFVVANASDQVGGMTLAGQTKLQTFLHEGYLPRQYAQTYAEVQQDFPIQNLFPEYPAKYEFYNPGFAKRIDRMTELLRRNNHDMYGVPDLDSEYRNVIDVAPEAQPVHPVERSQFIGSLGNVGAAPQGGNHIFYFELWERLPIPLFKMYSNDEIFGVIPNIVQMQIQGNFVSNLLQNILRCSDYGLNAELSWNGLDGAQCNLYLKWYTPPQTMTIPRELTIPYKKINMFTESLLLADQPVNLNGLGYTDKDVNRYGITLEAIPDLLLIYLKYASSDYALDTPDDFNAEWVNLTINIDNASGKLNQMTSWDLYNKWKRLLKQQDNKIITYDEWRRNCCVAALQPEDYGVRYGPGYSNSTNLSVVGKGRFWVTNPSIRYAPAEHLSARGGAGQNVELIIVSIYYRNSLTIRADGSASEELLRMAADFNMGRPEMGAVPPPDIRGAM